VILLPLGGIGRYKTEKKAAMRVAGVVFLREKDIGGVADGGKAAASRRT